ncbi:MAG: transporter [Desulfobacterales bacterium]|nr:transporter [Desulfobacterales bacterium]
MKLYKKICTIILFLIFFIILNNHVAESQTHGLPTGIKEFFDDGKFLPDGNAEYRFQLGGFYSLSKKFYNTDNDLVEPSSYKNYKRFGYFLVGEKKIMNDFLVGFTLPWLRSESYRNKTYYSVGDYALEGIGDIYLRGGWIPIKNELFSFYGELQIIITNTDKRDSFTDAYVYIGNDGHNAVSGKFAASYQPIKSFKLNGHVGYQANLSDKRVVIEGERAKKVSNGTMSQINAEIDPRDYFTLFLDSTYSFSNFKFSIGYEWFYETKDRISNIESDGLTKVEQEALKTVGGYAYIHSILAGIGYEFNKEFSFLLNYKTPFKGHYGYSEDIWSFMIERVF